MLVEAPVKEVTVPSLSAGTVCASLLNNIFKASLPLSPRTIETVSLNVPIVAVTLTYRVLLFTDPLIVLKFAADSVLLSPEPVRVTLPKLVLLES
jgi:hypothetical protein